jgi:hypothetical protein
MADWLTAGQIKGAPFGLEVGMKERGLWEANRRMMEIAGRAKSLRPAMVKVAAFLRYEIKRDWESGGAYSGNPWKANINDSYISWKRRHYPSSQGRVMHLSNMLRRALTTKYHPSHVEKVSRNGVEFGLVPSSQESKVAGALRAGRIGGGVALGGAPRGTIQSIAKRNAMQFRKDKTMQGVALIIGQYIETGFLPPSDHM